MTDEFLDRFTAAGELANQGLNPDEKAAIQEFLQLANQLDGLGFTEDESTEIAEKLVLKAEAAVKKWVDQEEMWRKSGNNQ